MIGALEQAWPPFVLVAGLLLIGLVAAEEGAFEVAAGWLERLPGPPVALFGACCLLVALTTALLNLDTAAVFITPVLLLAARRRGLDQAPFLYGALFMANASSLYLPGSNLTNLLVLSDRPVSGGAFLTGMLPAALAASVVTAAGVALLHASALGEAGDGGRLRGRPAAGSASHCDQAGSGRAAGWDRGRLGIAVPGIVAVVALVVVLSNPALPVLAVGLVAAGVHVRLSDISIVAVVKRLRVPVLATLFVVAVALGALARATGFPGGEIGSAGTVATAAIAALASVVVNNLPAAALLSAGHEHHLVALLVGLNIGPNLAVTGSLSALLWWQAACGVGGRPSALACTRQGLLLAPVAIAASLAVNAAAGGWR